MATAASSVSDTTSSLMAKRAKLLATIRLENERAMQRLARLERSSPDYQAIVAGIEERALEEIELRMSDFSRIGVAEAD